MDIKWLRHYLAGKDLRGYDSASETSMSRLLAVAVYDRIARDRVLLNNDRRGDGSGEELGAIEWYGSATSEHAPYLLYYDCKCFFGLVFAVTYSAEREPIKDFTDPKFCNELENYLGGGPRIVGKFVIYLGASGLDKVTNIEYINAEEFLHYHRAVFGRYQVHMREWLLEPIHVRSRDELPDIDYFVWLYNENLAKTRSVAEAIKAASIVYAALDFDMTLAVDRVSHILMDLEIDDGYIAKLVMQAYDTWSKVTKIEDKRILQMLDEWQRYYSD